MKKIGIYGAGAAGRLLAADLSLSKAGKVEFFIDDDPNLIGHDLFGCPIVSLFSVRNLELHQHIDEIIIALPSAPVDLLESIHNNLREFNKPIYSVPTEATYSARPLSSNDIVPYLVTNLVGRQMVNIETGLTRAFIEGKHVLITGAGGSIGSEIAKQCAMLAPSIITLIDSSEYALYAIDNALRSLCKPFTIRAKLANICDIAAIRNILKCTPDVVFHAAAYKHVPLVEDNAASSVKNNIVGTRLLLNACAEKKLKNFVLISSDKAVRPTNIMGATKRICELLTISTNNITSRDEQYSMVRFGNVMGSSGSVVPLFKNQIMSGGPVTITHDDITRFFMSVEEAAQLVIHAGSLSAGGEVFLLDMGRPVKIRDLAEKMIQFYGFNLQTEAEPKGIEIVTTGLRPGEKLFEELLIDGTATSTIHPNIFKSVDGAGPTDEFALELDTLIRDIDYKIKADIIRDIKKLVPEYEVSINSITKNVNVTETTIK